MSDDGWGLEPWGLTPWGGGGSPPSPPFVYPTPPTLFSGTTPDQGLAPDGELDERIPDWTPI